MILDRQWTSEHDEPSLPSLGFLYLFLAAFVYVAAHDTLWVVMGPWRKVLRAWDRLP